MKLSKSVRKCKQQQHQTCVSFQLHLQQGRLPWSLHESTRHNQDLQTTTETTAQHCTNVCMISGYQRQNCSKEYN